jgi:formate hydrogenlyase transcriptional activator
MSVESKQSQDDARLRQYRALLEVAESIAAHRDLSSLLHDLARRLQLVVKCDGINVVLHDPERNMMRVHFLELPTLDGAQFAAELPMEEAPAGLVWQTQQPLLMTDFSAYERRYSRAVSDLRRNGVKTVYVLPLTSAGRRLGALGFGSLQEQAWSEGDQEFLQQVANLVAVAVDNARNIEQALSAQRQFAHERDRLRLLLEINNAVVSHLDLRELVKTVSASLRDIMPHDAAGIALYEPELSQLREYSNVTYGELDAFREGDTIPLDGTPAGQVFLTGHPLLIRRPDLEKYPADRYSLRPVEGSPKSACLALLTAHGRKLGIVGVSSTQVGRFTDDDLELFSQIADQIAIAVENSLNFERARTADLELARKLNHLRLMLQVTTAVVSQLDLQELLQVVSSSIREVMGADTAGVGLYDHERGELRAYATDFPSGPGFKIPFEGSPGGLAFTSGQPVFLNKPDVVRFYSDFAKQVFEAGYRSGGSIPLIAQGRKLGVLGVASKRESAFSNEDKELLVQVANQVAIAVDNALNFERALKAEQEVKHQLERSRLMLEINNATVSHLDLRELVRVTAACLREVLQHEIVGLSLYDAETSQLRAYAYDFPDKRFFIEEGTPVPLEGSVGGLAFISGHPVFFNRVDPTAYVSDFNKRLIEAGVQSGGCVPLVVHGRKLGVLGVASFREDAFPEEHQQLLGQISSQIAIAVDNAINFERARRAEQEAIRQSKHLSTVLQINNAVVSQLDLHELLQVISQSLRKTLHNDTTGVALYDAESNKLRMVMTDFPEQMELVEESYLIPLEGSAMGMAFTSGEPVYFDHFDLEKFPSDFTCRSYEAGLRSACNIPLIAHGRKLGALGVASKRPSAFSADDIELLCQSASQIAIAVENALNFERTRAAEEEAKRQSERRQLLLEINNAVVSHLDLRGLMQIISASLRRISRPDVVGLALYDPDTNQLRAYAYDSLDKHFAIEEGTPIPLESSLSGAAFTTGQPIFHDRIDEERFQSDFSKRFRAAGLKSGGVVPLIAHGRKLGTLSVASYREANLNEDEKELLGQVASQVAIAVENALAFREIETLKNKLASEKLYLEDEIRTQHNFEELIGESQTFKRILKQVETVAPTDSTVLICGETGTGKELIARAIHDLSARRERTLVKLNCAAIPTGLLESELFGHEKGAFTGAISQRLGRFELANRGSLFLDEVGDIPLELQPKLLRVLQEQEFERLGSTRTQKVDVRLIAATNCDLEQMVADRKYRSDLYYRLNVFPITIPPLRQRRDDIPALSRFFTQKYARRLKKQITAIPSETMAALTNYHWPGNVRELEHFIERAVILTRGSDLEVSLAELKSSEPVATTELATLQDAERNHILRVLEETNWVIGGASGAAARLGMKRTTLQSRMQKLGIARSGKN